VSRYRRPSSAPLAGDLGGAWKMLLANFCNRRSTRAPVSSPDCRARSFTLGERCVDPADPSPPTKVGASDPRCARPPCGDPTPADPHIDGAVPASILPVHTDRCPRFPPLGGDRVGALLGAHDGAPLSGAAPLHERPLTSPVTHTRERPSVRSSVRVRRGPPLAAASSKATACDDPRRLPSAGAPWTRAFARAHPRYWMGACHRAPRFATR